MHPRWARDLRWSGAGRAVVPQTPPAETAAPAEPRDAEVVGVGDLRMVRTFRVGPDGELFPVNSAIAWTDGWNTATCIRGHDHRPPDADCRCGVLPLQRSRLRAH